MIISSFYFEDEEILLITNNKNEYFEIKIINKKVTVKEIKKENINDWFWAMDYRRKDLYNQK